MQGGSDGAAVGARTGLSGAELTGLGPEHLERHSVSEAWGHSEGAALRVPLTTPITGTANRRSEPAHPPPGLPQQRAQTRPWPACRWLRLYLRSVPLWHSVPRWWRSQVGISCKREGLAVSSTLLQPQRRPREQVAASDWLLVSSTGFSLLSLRGLSQHLLANAPSGPPHRSRP